MATKRLVSLRNNEAIVKIEGAAGAVTIDLDVDLLGGGEVLDGATQSVNIVGITWTSTVGTATIARNAIVVASTPAGSGSLGQLQNFFEDGGKTHDIVVTTAGGEVQLWIKLHKVGGYKTKFEPEQFGSYDNPAASGS